MMHDEYSPYKIVHHQDRLEMLRSGKQPAPLQIHLELTSHCNQNCIYCCFRSQAHGFHCAPLNVTVPTTKILETLACTRDMGVKALQLAGPGEPLLHPDFRTIITTAKEYGLEIGLITNGSLLRQHADILSDIAWLRVSLDAANAAEHAKIHACASHVFGQIISGIEELLARNGPAILGIAWLVLEENIDSIYEGSRFYRRLGVNNIRYSSLVADVGEAAYRELCRRGHEEAQRGKADFETGDFFVFNSIETRARMIEEALLDEFCPFKELSCHVCVDNNVYMCCTNAYSPAGKVGSIKDQSFSQLWNSPEKQRLFSRHSPRRMCPPSCWFKEKNAFINYCLKTDPRHVHFIG